MLSTRISIQWPPEEVGENTKTMVIYSNEGHFVDIRIFLDQYPIIQSNPESLENFTRAFEWATTGKELELEATIPETYRLQFDTDVNSVDVIKSIEQNLPLDACKGAADIGTFWKVPGSSERKETGSMVNPATGKNSEYVEIWRTISSVESTPEKEVLPKDNEQPDLYVLKAQMQGFDGLFIKSGNWCQGVLYDQLNKIVPLNVVRGFYREKWEYLIKYGSFEFPMDFQGKKGDTVNVDGISWTCIE